MTKMKRLVVGLFIFLIIAVALVMYVFFKPHRSVDSENAITVNADSLLSAYTKDENLANTLYLDKALTVSGEIAEINQNQTGQTVIILKTGDPISGVVCTIKDKPAQPLETGQKVTVKGFCSGYMTDVVIRDCQLISK